MSPFLFTDYVYQWLDNALDYGISESDFWEMTLAEIIRHIESRKRVMKVDAKEKATYYYVLADLIGRSVARIHSSSNQMPPIAEVFPSLFDSEEIEEKLQEKKDELSVLRFKQFTQSFNRRFNKEVGVNNE